MHLNSMKLSLAKCYRCCKSHNHGSNATGGSYRDSLLLLGKSREFISKSFLPRENVLKGSNKKESAHSVAPTAWS